ncbi:MAG: hypothetical protein AAGF35_11795 [Pseudomonadota bacterium]
MIDLLYCLLGWMVSGLCLLLIARRDPKRFRAHSLPVPTDQRYRGLLFIASLLPGVAIAMTGSVSAVIMWAGGWTVLGWLLALKRPKKENASV